MTRTFRSPALFAAALCAAALLTALLAGHSPALGAKAPPPAASLDDVKGDVTVFVAQDREEVDGEEDMELFEGDEVRTAKGAKATITFVDNHMVKLSERTRLLIKTVKADPVKKSFLAKLTLLGGRLVGSFSRLGSPGSGLKVETKTVVAAVKGTTFAVEDADEASTVSVLEGTVATAPMDESGREGDPVDLGEGTETTVDLRTRTVQAPRKFLNDMKRQWVKADLQDVRSGAGKFRALKATGQIDRMRRMRNLVRAQELAQRLEQNPKALDSLSPARRARIQRFMALHGDEARRNGRELKAFLRMNPALRARLAQQAEKRMRGKGREGGNQGGVQNPGQGNSPPPQKPEKEDPFSKLKDRFKKKR
jgi:hypothetical protein